MGKANVSEKVVARDNGKVASLNQAYLKKLADLGSKFKAAYDAYTSRALGPLNGMAGRDTLREASCVSNPGNNFVSELDVTSPVPGYLRELLVSASWGNAKITWDHMWPVLRKNYKTLQEVKAAAQNSATIAELRELNLGEADFGNEIKQTIASRDSPVLPSPLEGAVSGAVQGYVTNALQKWGPKLPAGAASIVGGGLILIYNYTTNKTILVPETMATFVGMLSPGWGIAMGVLIAAGHQQEAIENEYRNFAHTQLQKNVDISVPELVDAWGKHKNSPACQKAAAMEADCEKKRLANPKNPGGNCKASILDTMRR